MTELLLAAALALSVLGYVLWPMLRGAAPVPADDSFPEAEETRRGRAVAALREIEFDHATGKLSEDDYAALKARYTAEAVVAARAESVAGSAAAADLEVMIAARRDALAAGDGPAECVTCGPRPEPDARFCSTCGKRLSTGRTCLRCRAALPVDGLYCELCGASQAA
ncbi:MAG TPA: zinc ribbon domain-containing protein [Gemmatimonadales bacterium]|nr:zinc ribbon domain-containing protein [Gemmatimonadales bacterium]